MNLVIWFSWYKEILEELGFSRDDDEKSALILNKLLESSNCLSPEDIPIKDRVIVFGAGPSLKGNIKDLKNTIPLENVSSKLNDDNNEWFKTFYSIYNDKAEEYINNLKAKILLFY